MNPFNLSRFTMPGAYPEYLLEECNINAMGGNVHQCDFTFGNLDPPTSLKAPRQEKERSSFKALQLERDVMTGIFDLVFKFKKVVKQAQYTRFKSTSEAALSFSLSNAYIDPRKLAQVSSVWRELIYSTPTFWSNLDITCTDHKNQIPLMEMWLKNSRQEPLNIIFTNTKYTGDPRWNIEHINILHLLRTQSHRWMSLALILTRNPPAVLQTMGTDSFKILKSAMLSFRPTKGHENATFHSSRLWNAIHASPALQRVDWDGAYMPEGFYDVRHSVPWRQLAHITVSLPLDALLDMLLLCENLVTLDFEHLSAQHWSSRPPRRKILQTIVPHLEGLVFKSRGRFDFPNLFDLLVLPKLKRLRLCLRRTEEDHTFFDVMSITDLLRRSSTYLDDLALDLGDGPSSKRIIQVLQSPWVSRLTTLCIDSHAGLDLINFLAIREDSKSPPSLPMMKVLLVSQCTPSQPWAWSSMVYSRTCGDIDANLEIVRLEGCSSEDTAALEKLAKRRSDLDIQAISFLEIIGDHYVEEVE